MIVWLASYPRSGNTFFRVILNSVFNIKTYSIYNDVSDIGADNKTSEIVGHQFLPEDFDLNEARSSNNIYYIKTHELAENINLDNTDKVIYLVRDGRESSLSFTKYLKNFHKGNGSLTNVLYGNTPYGSWGEHVRQWKDTGKLLIKFEELTKDPSSILSSISDYLNLPTLNGTIPTFEELNKINPKFFNSGKTDSWKTHFTEMEHLAFWLRNFKEMSDLGYTNNLHEEVSQPSFQTYAALFNQEIDALKKNSYKDKLVTQKLNTQKEKNEKLENQIRDLNEAIVDLRTTKFMIHPIQKYKKYKKVITISNLGV